MTTAVYSSVACQEVHGSREESHGFENQTASVDLRIAWADRYALCSDLLRSGGRAYPYSNYLYARTVGIKPEAGQYTEDGQGMVYEFGIASVQYSALSAKAAEKDPDDPTQLVSETIEPTASFITLDFKKFVWQIAAPGVDLVPDEAPTKLMKGSLLSRVLYEVRNLNPLIITIAGNINSRRYFSRSLGIPFEIGTLLCNAPKLTRTITTDGVSAWTVALSWEHKPEGWNKFWRAASAQYETIQVRATGATYNCYPSMDFRPFLPG